MESLGGMLIGGLLLLAYLAWAVHVGNKVLTGRFAWLDKDAMPSKICKFILAVNIGSVIAFFYTLWELLKWQAKD